MTIEFDAAHTPSKNGILDFSAKIKEPFRFEATSSLKIIIELDDDLDSLQQFERAIQLLEILNPKAIN